MRTMIMGMILLFLVACSEKNKTPKGVLPPDRMEAVLADVLVADVYNNERILKDSSLLLPKENAAYFLKVFQLHNTTKNEFIRSYHFYLRRPDLFKLITDSVSSIINTRTTKLDKPTDTLKNRPHNGTYFKKTARPTGH